MQNNDLLLSQLALLLAGSGMSDEEMVRLLRQLRTTPNSLVLEQVQMYRGSVSARVGHVVQKAIGVLEAPRSAGIDKEAIKNVERLVVVEAGLPKMIAARAITKSLALRHPKTKFPSFNSKEGFAKWLSQIAEIVPLGELLHVAATLRNELVHSPRDDWTKGRQY